MSETPWTSHRVNPEPPYQLGDFKVGAGEPVQVWDGNRWLEVYDSDEDRMLGQILRRFLLDEDCYSDERGGEVVLDGYVHIYPDEVALVKRLIESRRA